MSTRKSISEIIDLFQPKADEFGTIPLTVKMVDWLREQYSREHRNAPTGRRPVHVRSLDGTLYDFVIYPNGAGFLRLA